MAAKMAARMVAKVVAKRARMAARMASTARIAARTSLIMVLLTLTLLVNPCTVLPFTPITPIILTLSLTQLPTFLTTNLSLRVLFLPSHPMMLTPQVAFSFLISKVTLSTWHVIKI